MKNSEYNNEPKYGAAISSFVVLFIVVGGGAYLTYNEIIHLSSLEKRDNGITIINELKSLDGTVTRKEIEIINNLDKKNLTTEDIDKILEELDKENEGFKQEILDDTKSLLEE